MPALLSIEELYRRDLAHQTTQGLETTPDGDLATLTGLNNVRAALFRRLQVTPGSLVHRPDYGVGIKDFLNAVNSLDNRRALAIRITEQFTRDDRVDSVLGMDIRQDETVPGKVVLFVRVTLRGFGEETFRFVPFGETVTND